MSQWDQFNNSNGESEKMNAASDRYQSESSEDIYNTPDVTGNTLNDVSEGERTPAEVIVESTPAEETTESAPVQYNYNPYSYSRYADNQNNNDPYSDQVLNDGQGGPYHNNQYGNNPYNDNQYGKVPYNDNPYGQTPYNSNPYDQAPYNSNPYGQTPHNDNTYGQAPYNGNPYGQAPYNNNQSGGNSYNNNPYSNNSYGNNQYNSPYGGQVPPINNQYSPYAVPPKKNKNGLILGIVIAVIVLFLIAIFALAYKAMTLFSEDRNRTRSSRKEYSFDYDDDDGWGVKPKHKNNRYYDDHDDYDDDYDDWFDYDYDDWYDDYDDYYDEDSEYYDLQDDIKWDLSYSVEFEDYQDDGDIHDDAYIAILYPVIIGDDVPNLARLNDAIEEEVDFLVSLADDLEENVWMDLNAEAYVTYMDEDRLSIVFQEELYLFDDNGDLDDAAYYLYSINIDMKTGVILDNENIINADDDFSVDFRQRSDIQNGEINYLTMLTDQEITDYFNSSDIIVFYTPMGMEIGFNFDDGWVTVTYQDYEQYLKVF